MNAPSIPAQRFCPVCGRTDAAIEMHHVIHRSQGGHKGPTIPLCKACHSRVHDERSLQLAYDDTTDEWKSTLDGQHWEPFVIADEQRDPDYPDVPDDGLWELLDYQARIDYLIAENLCAKERAFKGDRKALGSYLCKHYDFAEGSVGSYLTKRLAYGRLTVEGADKLGITAGYKLYLMVDSGADEASVVKDWLTMSKEQFNATHKVRKG